MALISDNIRELRVGMQSYETLILTAGFMYNESLYLKSKTNQCPDDK